MSKSKWRRFKPLATKRAPQKTQKTSKPSLLIVVGLFAAVGLSTAGTMAAIANNIFHSYCQRHHHHHGERLIANGQPVTAQPIAVSNDQFPAKDSKVPLMPAPRGVDEGNKLIAQGSGASSGGAVYDSMRRIVKIVERTGGTVTSTKQFVWAGDQLCEERDGSSAVTRRFFNQGEQIGGTSYYYTRDHNESVREMTNGAGAVQSQYGYGPWGEVAKLAGTGPDSAMQSAGMYKHERSGLNLAVNRAYSSSQGRWISRDPLLEDTFGMMPRSPEPLDPGDTLMASGGQPGIPNPNLLAIQSISSDPIVQEQLMAIMPNSPNLPPHQMNPYTYVHNNPISFTDRSGLSETPQIYKCMLRCILEFSPDPVQFAICVLKCHGLDPNRCPEPKEKG